MKRFITFMSALTMICVIAFAQEKTHVVKKGETLASIANTYGISVESLQNANPDSKSFLYVGMSLKVPDVENKETKKNTNTSEPSTITTTEVTERSVSSESLTDNETPDERELLLEEHKAGKGYVAWDFQLGLLDDLDGYLSTPISLGTSIRYSYFLNRNVYLSAGLGYLGAIQSADKDHDDFSCTSHYITVPFRLGASINPFAKFDLIPNAGINLNYCVAASTERNNKKVDNKLGGKMCIEGIIGARIGFDNFCIIAGYNFPLNDNQKAIFGKDGYFCIGIGAGF
ncbi:MAG: LysM peptidoglycan-binding domain-containing protein [Muribaculaceae bacterium]|nr:LysM peptidoglycan-binding domain-containing protein [Muribaculaceae bacterium]